LNVFQLFRVVIIGSTIPLLLYLVYIGIKSIRHSPKQNIAYFFTLSMGTYALSMIIYLLKPFLSSDQYLLAEFSMGGGLVLLLVGIVFYIEYLHNLYKFTPFFSKLFYYASAAGFISLLFNPWKIVYSPNLQVFTQKISDILLISIFVQIFCVLILFTRAFSQIKRRIKISENKEEIASISRKIDYIYLSYFVAAILIIFGLILQGTELDSLGIIVMLVPQALIFFKSGNFYLYLLAQRVGESTEDLHRNFITLMEQRNDKSVSPLALEAATKTLITFIEKADDLLQRKENYK